MILCQGTIHIQTEQNRRYCFDFTNDIVNLNKPYWKQIETKFDKEVEKHLTEINYLGI